MAFHRCGGGGLKPFILRIHASSGSASTYGQIEASATLPFYMVKRIELYAINSYGLDGDITLTVKGYEGGPETHDNQGTEIGKKTASKKAISTTNPLIIDLSNSRKYDYILIEISGTEMNYAQDGIVKIYPR